jgi:hypothetical protein
VWQELRREKKASEVGVERGQGTIQIRKPKREREGGRRMTF